jgi:tRNA threonylcarbamoyladenosine biosynthesis protein TsaB
MNLLLLETATDICSIGIGRNGQLSGLVEIDERADHAARINELILEACRQADCALTDIDAVAVSKGPGSYTSLRVGTATAKGICYALDKPLIAVDTLEAIARAGRQSTEGKWLYAPMIDARRMEVYTTFFDQDFEVLKAAHPLIVEPDVFSAYTERGFQIVLAGNGSEKCLEILPDNMLWQDVKCSARHLLQLAGEAFQNGQFEQIAYFEPFYLKKPNITKSKKRL